MSEAASSSETARLGLIVLGASRFPEYPPDRGLDQDSFRRSALAFRAAVQSPGRALLGGVEVLDLFNAQHKPAELVAEIQDFLSSRPALTDIIIYYCGHGWFLRDGRRSYALLLGASHPKREAFTALPLDATRHELEEQLRDRRLVLILDCCFAGNAVAAFQSGTVGDAIEQQVFEAFPRSGTTLLLASSKDRPGIAPGGEEHTMFTGGLVHVLQHGIADGGPNMTLDELLSATADQIHLRWGGEGVLPEIQSPRKSHGDLARQPYFRNVAYVEKPEQPAPDPDPLVEALKELQDPDPAVRRRALAAIAKVAERDQSDDVRAEASALLRVIEEPAAPQEERPETIPQARETGRPPVTVAESSATAMPDPAPAPKRPEPLAAPDPAPPSQETRAAALPQSKARKPAPRTAPPRGAGGRTATLASPETAPVRAEPAGPPATENPADPALLIRLARVNELALAYRTSPSPDRMVEVLDKLRELARDPNRRVRVRAEQEIAIIEGETSKRARPAAAKMPPSRLALITSIVVVVVAAVITVAGYVIADQLNLRALREQPARVNAIPAVLTVAGESVGGLDNVDSYAIWSSSPTYSGYEYIVTSMLVDRNAGTEPSIALSFGVRDGSSDFSLEFNFAYLEAAEGQTRYSGTVPIAIDRAAIVVVDRTMGIPLSLGGSTAPGAVIVNNLSANRDLLLGRGALLVSGTLENGAIVTYRLDRPDQVLKMFQVALEQLPPP